MSEGFISNALVSEALDCAWRGNVDINALLTQAQIDAPSGGQVSPEAFGRLWLGIANAMND